MAMTDATLGTRPIDEHDSSMDEPNSVPLAADPAWQAALDWHLRLSQTPQDEALMQACQQWQAAAEEHARAWRKLQRVWQLSGGLTPLPAIPAAPTQTAPRPRRTQRRRLLLAATAACLCLALLPMLVVDRAQFSTAIGETRELTLADGSQVTLDSDSALSSHFSADRRDIKLLRGRAYFQVRADASRPFIVEAGSSQVRVTGTAFSVYHDEQRLDVSVEHGSVQVSDPQLPTQAPLAPGDHLRLLADGVMQRNHLSTKQMAAWRKGLLIANDTPLPELLETLNRHQHGLILLRDDALARQTVTGVFDLRDPHQALQALVAPLGGQIQHYGPVLTLITRAQ